MSRSLTAAPGRRRAASAGRRGGRAAAPRSVSVPRPVSRFATAAEAAVAFAWRRRLLRVLMLGALIAVPVLGGGWLWLRQSSFVSVRRVQIVGVRGPEAQAVGAALTRAAHRMSTLDVNTAALRAAVAPLLVVRAVRATASFPHGLRIEVSEQLPVASLAAAGVRTAVAADGVVLGPALLSGSLPSVSGSVAPAPGRRVRAASLLAALAVLGAAPAPLAVHVERVFTGAEGLTMVMRNGLLVYFGDASRPHAKWLSLVRVLADPSSAGASYVDVRLPSRPAAGFPAGVTPPDASAATATGSDEQLGSTESTVAALAAGLSSGHATTPPTATEPGSASAPGPVAPAGTPSMPGADESTGEAGAGGEAEDSQTSSVPGGQ